MTGIEVNEDFVVDNDQLIYENDMYSVLLGPSEISADFSGNCYKVRNKVYDIIELETTVLMKALFSADDFEAHVKAHTEMQQEGVTLS
jgi:hypothetical protein